MEGLRRNRPPATFSRMEKITERCETNKKI
jgi:hypothetical protein